MNSNRCLDSLLHLLRHHFANSTQSHPNIPIRSIPTTVFLSAVQVLPCDTDSPLATVVTNTIRLTSSMTERAASVGPCGATLWKVEEAL